MHEDVAEEEHGDRVVEAVGAGLGMADLGGRRGRVVEERLDAVAQRDPRAGGIVVDRRADRQRRPAGGGEEGRHPLDQVAHDVPGDPAVAGRRVAPTASSGHLVRPAP